MQLRVHVFLRIDTRESGISWIRILPQKCVGCTRRGGRSGGAKGAGERCSTREKAEMRVPEDRGCPYRPVLFCRRFGAGGAQDRRSSFSTAALVFFTASTGA